MTRQAIGGQDGTADGDTEPENTEPEISGRDQRYREQRRQAEIDRDQLRGLVESMQRRGLVESMQRQEIERLASPRHTDPRDLWYRDASVAGLLTENGDVDPVKVDAAVTDLLEQPSSACPVRSISRR